MSIVRAVSSHMSDGVTHVVCMSDGARIDVQLAHDDRGLVGATVIRDGDVLAHVRRSGEHFVEMTPTLEVDVVRAALSATGVPAAMWLALDCDGRR